ncbi:MAG: hypothetical protein HKN07_08115 [Acidimicrobiia bacterium]|nr:hypothetical protein [Acidimicrobiia bacterium]
MSTVLYAECPRYEVTAVLEAPDCGFQAARILAWDINVLGDVVGCFSCPGGNDVPFIWHLGSELSVLDLLDGITEGRAYAVNDVGQVTGFMGPPRRGFLLDGDDVFDFGLVPESTRAESLDINNSGMAVGFWTHVVVGPTHGFIWQDGKTLSLADSIGADFSRARGVNNFGQVVGWRQVTLAEERIAFLWDDGVVTELGVIPGGCSSEAFAINDGGAVVGYSELPAPGRPGELDAHAFLWRDGEMVDLGTLPGLKTSMAHAINSSDQVVGVTSSSGVGGSAFLWEGGCMFDLNDLVPPEFGRPLGLALSLNDVGQILVTGLDFAAVLSPTGVSLADVDGDCVVGFGDLLAVISDWGRSDTSTDFNCDMTVDFRDLLFLLAHWG